MKIKKKRNALYKPMSCKKRQYKVVLGRVFTRKTVFKMVTEAREQTVGLDYLILLFKEFAYYRIII